jgi:predicted membrane channel-forming protein YqfA (hemolysin III family)
MGSEKMDLNRRDYCVKDITNYDRRFEDNQRDYILFHGVGVILTIVVTVLMFMTGSGQGDASKVSFIFGYPAWWVFAFFIYLAMLVWGLVRISKWEKFSLEAKERQDEV